MFARGTPPSTSQAIPHAPPRHDDTTATAVTRTCASQIVVHRLRRCAQVFTSQIRRPFASRQLGGTRSPPLPPLSVGSDRTGGLRRLMFRSRLRFGRAVHRFCAGASTPVSCRSRSEVTECGRSRRFQFRFRFGRGGRAFRTGAGAPRSRRNRSEPTAWEPHENSDSDSDSIT